MKKKTLSYFCKRAVELGAKKAKIIAATSVKTAPWVRYKCQFGCDGYAGCLTCNTVDSLQCKASYFGLVLIE